MHALLKQVCFYAFLIILQVGCSNSTGPVIPAISDQAPATVSDTDTTRYEAVDPISHNLWTWQFIHINTEVEPIEYEVIPSRQVMGHWNVLSWMENGPCKNCFSITQMEQSGNGTLLIDVQIKHPFATANLTGFDVRGIAMFNGSRIFPILDLTTPDRSQGDGELVNPDGYTTLYNPSTFGSGPGGFQGYIKGKFASATWPNATLNGYKRYISPGSENTRNAFYAGTSLTSTFEIDMPDGNFIMGYAVDACWVKPNKVPVTDPMLDFPSFANCEEPYRIDTQVAPIGDGLTNYGGEVKITMNVYDWKGKFSYSTPMVECPELFNNTVEAVYQGDSTGYTTWTATIGNVKLAPAGDYAVLISVTDKQNDTAPVWLDLTAYQIIKVTVNEHIDTYPIAKASANPTQQSICANISFSAVGSYDPDGGAITKYEWDWDNDGTYDQQGVSVAHSWTNPGNYHVQLRITDNEGSTDTLDSPLQITIIELPPTAVGFASANSPFVGQFFTLDGTGSYDNDCSGEIIVKYEWDYTGDGIYDQEGAKIQVKYDTPGPRSIQLRVTDNEGSTDTLDTTIDVTAVNGWAITWGSDNFDYVSAVSTDTSGNIHTVGGFSGEVDFDPGFASEILISAGYYDAFICKYSPDAELIWAKKWGGVGYDVAEAITFDSAGNIYVIGYFNGEVNFAPDGTPAPQTSNGKEDVFISKFTSDGVFQWVRAFGSIASDGAVDVAAMGSTDLFITGYYEESADFDWGGSFDVHVSHGNRDAFVLGMKTTGAYGWSRTWGAHLSDQGYGIAVSLDNKVYVAGGFRYTVDFNETGGGDIIESGGSSDAFLTKYEPDGSYGWTKTWGGPDIDTALAIYASGTGTNWIYATGTFENNVDLDPGVNVFPVASNGDTDVFVSRFDPFGEFSWGLSFGGTGIDEANAICGNVPDDRIVLGGYFSGTVDFDPGPAAEERVSLGHTDNFLMVLSTTPKLQWVSAWGGNNIDYTTGVTFDTNGLIYAVGGFWGTVDFNAGPGIDEHTSIGLEDSYLVRYPSDGQW